MKKPALVLLAIAALAAAGPAGLRAQTAPPAAAFAFRFEPGVPRSYATGVKVAMDMDMKSGTEGMKMKMVFDLRYRVKLTPVGAPKDGVTTLRLEPSGIEGDWDIGSPAGHILLELRGAHMKGTQGGVTVIDTEHDVGTVPAQEFKKELAPLYLGGQIEVDARGNVRRILGDPAFVKFWTDALESQNGFWGVVFPERPVPVGAAWEEALVLKKMGEIRLEGDGLRCTTRFTRRPDETAGGRALAVFDLAAPFSEKNLAGRMEQMGASSRVNIASFDRRASGTFRFDPARGQIVEGRSTANGTASIATEHQGRPLTIELTVDMEMRVNAVDE